jgi:raffinose/stachyose/melibiose transport system substrate-binding protein
MSPLQQDSYKTKLKLAMGAGAPPCVFTSWGGGPFFEYVRAGAVLDLTPRLGVGGFRDRFIPAAFSMGTLDGKVWGVPLENSPVALVFYNRAQFARLGLTPPRTWDDLVAIVHKLRAAGIAPFALANKSKWPGAMYYMVLSTRLLGAAAFDAAAAGQGAGLRDPAFVRAGALIQELVRMGAFVDGFQGLDYETGQTRMLLYAGKAAMELMGSWMIPNARDENPAYAADLDFFPFPAIAGGRGDPGELVGSLGDQVYSVSTACPHPDEAFALIRQLTDDAAVTERIQEGYLPPLKGVRMKDPLMQRLAELVQAAPRVQLWYDQYLPPEVGEAMKDAVQGLFGLALSPEQAAAQIEAAAGAVRAKRAAALAAGARPGGAP